MILYEILLEYYKKIKIENLYYLKNKVIFITGANGLLGSNFISYFHYLNNTYNMNISIIAHSYSKPLQWLPVSDNITYLNSDLKDLNIDFHFDYLIHLATYGQPKKILENKLNTILLNTIDYINLLEKARENNATVLFLSSSSIYGEISQDMLPISEEKNGLIPTLALSSIYAESKRMAEVISKIYIDDYKLNIKIIRTAIVYGPGIKANDKRFLGEFIMNALNYNKIQLIDNGKAKRQLLFITDALEMMLNCMLGGKEILYNTAGIFSEENNTIINIAKIIANSTQSKIILPDSDLSIEGTQSLVHLDISKYLNEFPKKEFVSIYEGINLLINWIKKIKNNKGE
ncbi:NAD-dependent epimerase/dehydratase family protein [Campylobacter jejuni]|uniref:NAD-dependent epimerase/dehydratase family protein n=1 Tax=Campylobacter jejuni TaxID=197 RepID=UPI0009A9B308|nr:NAD-dependent epimerase/dehydratase family protein [Campylobacter jejuni]